MPRQQFLELSILNSLAQWPSSENWMNIRGKRTSSVKFKLFFFKQEVINCILFTVSMFFSVVFVGAWAVVNMWMMSFAINNFFFPNASSFLAVSSHTACFLCHSLTRPPGWMGAIHSWYEVNIFSTWPAILSLMFSQSVCSKDEPK